ncbi:MAG: DUF47 family protein [Lentisphaerae bacterium]|nr:MAG: DUF47 family protein [Lentisphaerota bacterium]
MWMFQSNRQIREKINRYLAVYEEVLVSFEEAMCHYIQKRIDDHYFSLVEQIHQSESQADDLRRDIERELFRKMLLPEIREDICMIIDRLDQIPTLAEKIARRIYTHNILLPEIFNDKLEELVTLGVSCSKLLKVGVEDVLNHCSSIQEVVRKIDAQESVCDKIENQLLFELFHSDGFPAHDQILFRDLILWVADLPDVAEKISDQLTIFAIKRHV